jgi:glutathione synthase/RimK-type ligase-like ATP-grasp enzyme
MILFEDEVIYGFDFLNNKDKLLIPEINPSTIFYANAAMSLRK